VKLAADAILWALVAAAPLSCAAPFALQARHRTPAKITAAVCTASWATGLAACAAWRLR
jgi:hypothetical protein